MNVEIATEAAQFPEKEYINGIFLAVCFTDTPVTAFMCSCTFDPVFKNLILPLGFIATSFL
jgi:hypothetical protein